ncbi:MAG: oligosaccharide flippase family protein [Longicatena sp.]
MKKTILRSTLLLILISTGAKVLSFIVRILLARTLSPSAMNFYSLASPTLVFVITLAQMGIPSALSKVIAQSRHALKPLMASTLLSIINNLVISIVYIVLLPFLAVVVLKQPSITSVLWTIVPMIPLVSLSGLLKGYLYGKQEHLKASSSQLFEEASRILFLLWAFQYNQDLTSITMARIAMLSLSVGEGVSALYMLVSILFKKHTSIHLSSLFTRLYKEQFDEVLSISIPLSGSRFIGSLTYFIEPILMVLGLSLLQSQSMVSAYGQLNGYVLPIITMPSFISVTLSNYLLPSFTYYYTRGNIVYAKKLMNMILGCCFLVGFSCSFLCYFYNEELLLLFYHSTHGSLILKQLAWPFALYSLQPALSSLLVALSLSKKSVIDTFLGSLTRVLCILILAPSLLTNALPLALASGMLVTTLAHAFRLWKALTKTTYS